MWREGGATAAMILRYKLAWIGYPVQPDLLTGPVPPAFEIDIGSRYVVWSEYADGQFDIYAYDLDSELERRITNTPGIDENAPATSGAWIVWRQKVHDATETTIQAHNMDSHDMRTIAANGVRNYDPAMDGDLLTWESDPAGNFDVWVYRFSTGETFAVTTEPHDQYLDDVFGNLVAYVDMRRGTEDVWASRLTFLPPDFCADQGGDGVLHAGQLSFRNGLTSLIM